MLPATRPLLSLSCVLLGACATLPPPPARDDDPQFRVLREEPHYRVRVREVAPTAIGARFQLPVARIPDTAETTGVTASQAHVVATHAARSTCLALSPWVQWIDADDAGRITLELRRIGASSSGLAATSALVDAVVPGPFRLPAGLGALELDSKVESADGRLLLELRWARGANPLLHRARASSIGDAWELAPSHARDLKAALAPLWPVEQPPSVREANIAACNRRFGEVSVAGRAASLLVPLSPEALDPADDTPPSPR